MLVEPLPAELGARVTGVDLHAPSDDELAAIQRAIDEHGVVVVPAQDLAPLEQLAFSRCFGLVEEHPLGHNKEDIHDGTPDIHLVRVVQASSRNGGWHAVSPPPSPPDPPGPPLR
eukprot:COSAG04_NODE_5818_length_1485_cov_1.257576_1_plen_115_part_00